MTSSKITALVVDDSSVIRGFITRIIDKHDDIDVVGIAADGQMAIDMYNKHTPDVVVMDIEMPVMNGIEALQKILDINPQARIIICSTLSVKNADITMKALRLGAADCIAKPTSAAEINSSEQFRSELITKILSIGNRPRSLRLHDKKIDSKASGTETLDTKPMKPEIKETGTNSAPVTQAPNRKKDIEIRPLPIGLISPKIICIGSSTGGPQALFDVIKHLNKVSVPIVITQHMPPTFTNMLAKHISMHTDLPCHEGEENMRVEPGHGYVAPGGFHMVFEKHGTGLRIKLLDTPPENFCKPSVDPMFKSAVEIYGNRVLGIMLTGMGHDGLDGSRILVEKGNRLIAQDKETSVVWGMPGAVAHEGLCHEILPLQDIGPKIRTIVQ